jgi:hypothetical protein
VDYLDNRVARANTCYVCHAGGGLQESGGHPGSSTDDGFATDFKQNSPKPDPSKVQVALDNTGDVLDVSWGAGKPQPVYNGNVALLANETNGWKTCSNTNCHYGLPAL